MADMDPTQRQGHIDWKQVGDYLLGRSTLIGVASMMLLTISAYATWLGMRDFVMGVSDSAPTSGGSIPNDLLVIMVVVALTFLMWLAMRETFGSHRRLIERFITIPLYVFLALWSIGFGYGFWWSLIAVKKLWGNIGSYLTGGSPTPLPPGGCHHGRQRESLSPAGI
jgi:hypothetical protein